MLLLTCFNIFLQCTDTVALVTGRASSLYKHVAPSAILKGSLEHLWVTQPSVSQVRVALAAVATALHCERSCATENVSVRDMPVSEEM